LDTMEKNLVVFIILSILVFMGWGYYQNKYVLPAQKISQALADQKEHSAPAEAVSSAVLESPASADGGTRAVFSGAKKKESVVEKEQTIEIKTKVLKVVLTSRGAQVKSWKLLPYHESIENMSPVELIPPDSQGALGIPAYGALQLKYADLEFKNWKLETREPLKDADGSQRVVFSTVLNPTPLVFRKIFVFATEGFISEIKIEIANPDDKQWDLKNEMSLTLGPNLGKPGEGRMENMATSAVVQTKNKLSREALKNKNETASYANPRWIALKNQYFAGVFISESDSWTKAEVRHFANNTLYTALVAEKIDLPAGAKVELKARLLGGPLKYSLLKDLGLNLHRVIQFNFMKIFAWLDPLSVGMLLLMNWLYKVIGNYGIAIIVLTLLVRLLLAYPSQKSMVSMRKMQKAMEKAKPRLDALRKTHKDDPQAMNQEMMKIYREYGINPLGGCLPMLIQLPILFALYPVFYAAFELRGQGFFWKWEDLTTGDPTHIMPLLMGISMFLQQKLTPQAASTADPTQAQTQKMLMYMMPIMLTGMSIWFKWPSGFLLYWGASNMFSIAQQLYVNKLIK
jgi:YidC/Oxa1 family membrane protein insertase